jgi:hypothetical protein
VSWASSEELPLGGTKETRASFIKAQGTVPEHADADLPARALTIRDSSDQTRPPALRSSTLPILSSTGHQD